MSSIASLLDSDTEDLPESRHPRSPAPFHRSQEAQPKGGARSAQITPLARIPRAIEDALDRPDLPPRARMALLALREEVATGTVCGLREDAPDRALWDALSAPLLGRSWLDAPCYLAEAFFYRRVLEATGYHRPGTGEGIDPYAHKKEAEIAGALREIETFAALAPEGRVGRLHEHLLASLWGNRADLCHPASRKLARRIPSAGDLVVDHTAELEALFQDRPLDRVVVITDNAATELVNDLLLVDFLLEEGFVERIELHVKPAPCFVSDVTMADIGLTLSTLLAAAGRAGVLGRRLVGHFHEGRLSARTHWFYGSSLFFSELPDDLRADLAGSDLVLLKGDLDYRRLLGDIKWPTTTSFSAVTAYFPAPVAVLRTMKAEIVVGLGEGQFERLAAEDPDWMVNGRRAVLQVRSALRPRPR